MVQKPEVLMKPWVVGMVNAKVSLGQEDVLGERSSCIAAIRYTYKKCRNLYIYIYICIKSSCPLQEVLSFIALCSAQPLFTGHSVYWNCV